MEEEDAHHHGVVIVGGGICGLATALALHRKGMGSLVLEKSETLRADGVAIGILANGWRALEQLGVAAELRDTCNLITAYHNVWQAQNKSNLVPIRKELRCMKRKDLVEALAKNLPDRTIHFGCHVAAIDSDSGSRGAILTTIDGRTIKAKVVIGCDGSNSVVAKYLGLPPASHISRTVFRGFTRYPHGQPFENNFLRLKGKGFTLGRAPMTDNLVFFFISGPSPSTDITKDMSAMKDFVLETHLRGCPPEIAEMVRDADPESLYVETKIWYRPPWQVMFGRFQRGTATIAGDAMHVMGPFIGQGGSAGLEDAVVLARSMSQAMAAGGGSGDRELNLAAAIGEYVRERRPRVAMLSLESFVMGILFRAQSLSLFKKLACMVILALLGSESLRHADYDCGRL